MKIKFQWIGGATFILHIDNLKIAVDPVLCPKGSVQDYFWFKSERIEAPVYQKSDFKQIDLWLITHNHEDHIDQIGLAHIDNNIPVISNKNTAKLLKRHHKNLVAALKWKQNFTLQIKTYQISIEAVAAIHGVNPLSALLAGKGNGYFVSIQKGNENFSFYLTGDTVYTKKIKKQLVNKKIDLMIPNMGAAQQNTWIMTLTLNSKMLKKLIRELQPVKVIPVHYGTFKHYKEPVSKIKALQDSRIGIIPVGSHYTLI